MTKTALETMLEQLLRQNALLTEMLTEQQKQLRAQGEQLEELRRSRENEEAKKKDELDPDGEELSLDDDDEGDDEPMTPEQRHESEKEHIMLMLETMGEETHDHMPKFTDFVKKHDIDNLKDFSEGMFLHLMRRHFGIGAVQGYRAKRFEPFLHRSIVRYFDMLGDDHALNISDEDRAAAEREEEQLCAAAKEAARAKMGAAKGAFRLQGREDLERFFNEQVVHIVTHLDDYAAMGIGFPRPFILEGPPGCGKTYAVEKLAEHLAWKTYRLNSGTIGSTYVHGTAKKISEVFAEAEENAPALIIIDEMDAFMPDRARSDSGDHHHQVEEVDCFLQLLQGAAENNILVVGMTNYLDRIDPAILRTGRMGTHFKVGMPSLAEVQSVLRLALEKRPHAENIDLAGVAAQLLDHPLSDVTYVADEAAMVAVRAGHKRIEAADLDTALAHLRTHNAAAPRRALGFCA